MQENARQCNTMQYNKLQYNAMQYNAINAMQQYNRSINLLSNLRNLEQWNFRTIQCNAKKCNTMQCNSIPLNSIQTNVMSNKKQCKPNTPTQFNTTQPNITQLKENLVVTLK